MELAIPGYEDVAKQLAALEKSVKPKLLVVDDEPDNLDLLYRTFRRDFRVMKADSGAIALEILATEGEVAVIISDQRMPEMKGTEFLSRTVPQFPDTVRIILTGFTDVEDLVEAINSGQVYKYITKPWEPTQLKKLVYHAAETYDLMKQRSEDLQQAMQQTTLLNAIAQATEDASSCAECLQIIAGVLAENFAADRCVLQLLDGQSMTGDRGAYPATEPADWLTQDPLILGAIETQQAKMIPDIAQDGTHANFAPYAEQNLQAHLVAPLLFQKKLMGIASFQWQRPCPITVKSLLQLHVIIQQVTLALSCTHCH